MVDPTHVIQYRPVTKAAATDRLTDRTAAGTVVSTTGALVGSMTREEADRFGVDLERSGTLFLELPTEGTAGLDMPTFLRSRPIQRPLDAWIYWRVSAGAIRRDAGDEADHLYVPLERLDKGYPTTGWS